MSDTPIIEQIAAKLAEVIGAVEGVTALRPRRVFFMDEVTADRTAVITQESPEKLDGTLHTQEWRQPFGVVLIVTDSDTATDPIDTRLNALRSDIEKAVLADVSLDGLAIDTTVEPPQYFSATDLTGVELRFNVHYRTAYNDPYIQM